MFPNTGDEILQGDRLTMFQIPHYLLLRGRSSHDANGRETGTAAKYGRDGEGGKKGRGGREKEGQAGAWALVMI